MHLIKKRPRQGSHLETSDPKSDALSIRPRGRYMFSAIFIVPLHTPKSKKVVALFDCRLVHGVWPFITPGAFWGKTAA